MCWRSSITPASIPCSARTRCWSASWRGRRKKVRILSLGTLVSLRPDPVRIAEEYATADIISRGRLDIGFVKSGGTEMPSANANPVGTRSATGRRST